MATLHTGCANIDVTVGTRHSAMSKTTREDTVTMEKVQIHISDASHVTPLSTDYSEHLYQRHPSCYVKNEILGFRKRLNKIYL
jgi:ABC-type phosphate transport system substrate-binding protein